MPSHNHGGATGGPSNNTSGTASPASTGNNSAAHTHSIPSLSGTAASAGEHTHSVNTDLSFDSSKTGGYWNYIAYGTATNGTLSSAGAHTHTVTTNKSTSGGVSANHTHSL